MNKENQKEHNVLDIQLYHLMNNSDLIISPLASETSSPSTYPDTVPLTRTPASASPIYFNTVSPTSTGYV